MNNRLLSLYKVVVVLLILVSTWVIVDSILTSETSGILSVKSSDTKANLIISQPGRQAKIIGSGEVKVRLKAGTYDLLALDSGKQASATVNVQKKQTTLINLGALQSITLPIVSDVSFQGFNNFTNYGMQYSQLQSLELAIFSYSKLAKTIAVDPSSISLAPYNSDSTSTLSNLTFSVSVDGTPLNANLTYDNLSNYLSLVLDNQNNVQVFSYNTSSQNSQ
jgi:hypothetical protein